MVCMGNICRSPTAHGVLQAKVAAAGLADCIAVDSAGTHGYHVGEPPDARAQHHAAQRGYDLSGQRARQLQAGDFTAFDLVLVMDAANERLARALCPAEHLPKLLRLGAFARQHAVQDVPDPYYGAAGGFAFVLDLVEDACDGLLARLAPLLLPHSDGGATGR